MTAVDPLVCATCGKGPFMDARAVGAHRVSHETVVCDVCGAPVNRRGLGAHRVGHRRVGGPHETELAALRRLIGVVAGPEAMGRLTKFLQGAAVFPAEALIVICEDRGPFIVARSGVGDVVAGTRRACVVAPLQVAADAALAERHAFEFGGVR